MSTVLDDKFCELLPLCPSLPAFFDQIFGFLYRNTDFYRLCDSEAKLGFPLGVNKQILLSAFEKWESIANDTIRTSDSNTVESVMTPCVAKEVVIDHSTTEETTKTDKKANETMKIATESFNGADRGSYRWSQTATDVDVTISTPESVSKASQLRVKLKTDRICVQTESSDLLIGQWSLPINVENSTWSFNPEDHNLVIYLEKTQKDKWWDRLFELDPKIDVSKLEIVEELTDEREKMKIEEMLTKHQQQ